ncbi:MAG: hypothetical protein MZV70_75840 [Desulfobacterales bacterium]|nr:hypothetical protein [Desulfobacterales bacterium]
MSKSYGNAIFLSDSAGDGRRQGGDHDHRPAAHAQERPGQPGRLQRLRLPQALLAGRRSSRTSTGAAASAEIGCVECKKLMARHLNAFLDPIRERRRFYQERPGRVEEIITAGSDKARADRLPDHGGRPGGHQAVRRTEVTVTDTARSRGRAPTASSSRTSSRARWTCWCT